MTAIVALDVVIGLVFIYLLYSLFATIILEIINTFLGLRARNLRYTLRRMLRDEKTNYLNLDTEKRYKKQLNFILIRGNKLANNFSKFYGKSTNLKEIGLFDKFYDQPSIKYLSSGGISNKPSYISSQNFSKVLIDTLESKAKNSKTKPQHSIDKIKLGLSKLPENSDTRTHLESLVKDSKGDMQKFRFLLEKWYDETMDRSSGWFKRRMQYMLIVIGFVLAVNFNANTIYIIKTLSNDKDAREHLVAHASNYTKENETLIAQINELKKNPTDSAENDERQEQSIREIIKSNNDYLNQISRKLQNDIAESQNIISSNWKIPDSIEIDDFSNTKKDYVRHNFKLRRKISDKGKDKIIDTCIVSCLIYKTIDHQVFQKSIPSAYINSYNKGKINIDESVYKWNYVFSTTGFLNFKYLWGYILTALAISLGSQFWFDLLNKLIKLRSSIKPKEIHRTTSKNNENQTPNPMDIVG